MFDLSSWNPERAPLSAASSLRPSDASDSRKTTASAMTGSKRSASCPLMYSRVSLSSAAAILSSLAFSA